MLLICRPKSLGEKFSDGEIISLEVTRDDILTVKCIRPTLQRRFIPAMVAAAAALISRIITACNDRHHQYKCVI